MTQYRRALCTLFALLLLSAALSPSAGAAPQLLDLPVPLRPWVSWVLHGHEAERCSFLHGSDERRCDWPARLELDLDARGGTFAQEGVQQSAGAVLLPGGGPLHWPVAVQVDGHAAVVVARDDRPVVWLGAGPYRLRGRLRWPRLPESVMIPAGLGLVSLRIEGRAVDFPERAADGTLAVQRRAEAAAAENRLDLTVTRRLIDELPLELETQLELRVAGKARELALGPVLPAGFVPLALDAALPTRVEPDGRLRVQLRPGTFTLTLRARQAVVASRLLAPPASSPWVEAELWVFEARPALRVVAVQEAPAVDPGQTRLPEAWKHLPAYRLVPGAAIVLAERRRGDSAPAADALALRRRWWLDFDGGGFTVADAITGSVRRSQRLEMGEGTELGHVVVGGEDRLVTRRGPATRAAVEVRRGAIELAAESRTRRNGRQTPAVGWAHDFRALSGEVHLPPGWTLLHVGGADAAGPTWVSAWRLDDVFLLLVLLLAMAKLFGARVTGLAALALIATLTEEGAPRWSWAVVLAVEALARVWPSSARGHALLQLARTAALVVVALLVVAFSARQLRQGVFPSLDPAAWGEGAAPAATKLGALSAAAAPVPFEVAAEATREDEGGVGAKPERRERLAKVAKNYLSSSAQAEQADATRLMPANDPSAMVQTGPGIPRWEGRRVNLGWNGPVSADERLSLWLVRPWLNRVLAGLRVLLLAALVLSLGAARWRGLGRGRRGAGRGGSATGPALVALFLVALSGRLAQADGAPPPLGDEPRLHAELRRRLLEAPPCFPQCAAIGALALRVSADRLAMLLEVAVTAETAVPLPGHAEHWQAQQVRVNGKSAAALARAGGTIWLSLVPGTHRVELEGALPLVDSLQLPLPLKPRQVEAELAGWRLEGLHDDGTIDDQLQLTREAPAASGGASVGAGQPHHLPPFVRVERTLRLGLTWEVATRVVRMTPPGSAIVLAVPLLSGESVTSAGVHVRAGSVLVSIEAAQQEVSWRSALPERSALQLRAPAEVPWVERWSLEASPIWHVEAHGPPPLHQTDEGAPVREWAPLPGEALRLAIDRPKGVAGQVLTVEHLLRQVSVGDRRTETVLRFAVRTSRGAEHVLTLPEGAELEKVMSDGQEQPLRQEGRRVALALHPGTQELELRWSEPVGWRTRLRLSAVALGAPAVNVSTEVIRPVQRWVLFLGGAGVGPVVLFWSQLALFLVVALALSRLPFSPLAAHQWLLLGVGLTQLGVLGGATVAGWLLYLAWRGERVSVGPRWLHNSSQLAIAGGAVVVLGLLVASVYLGLLGNPDMQISGNGSGNWAWGGRLRWFDDRIAGALNRQWIVSVPLWVYRVASLAWALWLATAVISWLRWGWRAFTRGGIWQRKPALSSAAVAQPTKE
ncbi:MAG: hypothetical protein IPL40_13700 [Proteobacteria bacterium]|nr:hypothetical protein [Pseudomonadota bacterium]